MTFRYFLSMLILSMLPVLTYAQKDTHNDESKVPNISLPDLFVNSKGQEINSIQEWEYKRRPEIVNLYIIYS